MTAQPRPGVDEDRDMPLLAAALGGAAEVVVAAWDSPLVDWAMFDLAVIRSTWDYSERSAEFIAWVGRCAGSTRLVNPASVIRWNVDKSYLDDLQLNGVPVVRTTYLRPGGPVVLPGEQEYVLKPSVGAGGRFAARYQPHDTLAAMSHVQRLHRSGVAVLVQPYVATIERAGERALVFVEGEFVHAVRKGPVLARGAPAGVPDDPHPALRTWQATAAELMVARHALAAVPTSTPPLYARVDLVDDERGEPMVMELELIEPNLFLSIHPGSVPLLARAVIQAATGKNETQEQVFRNSIGIT